MVFKVRVEKVINLIMFSIKINVLGEENNITGESFVLKKSLIVYNKTLECLR